uniref:Uncharacterized protein n=1 Tax=Timema bartmani TaxID=61472 RepID=A0A7R9EWX4_9NEOP|nr:unnamed protein product [Timema bartmani]
MGDDGFIAQHRSDSRQWLTKMQSHPDTSVWSSVSDSTFAPPDKFKVKTVGRRQELIERFFWQQLTEEALQKLHQPLKVEKYSSEYDGSFNDEEFTPSSAQLNKNTNLYKKYPLYKDPPLSYWLQNKQNIQGITTPPDYLQPFKKNTAFSKPLEEILDEPHSF